MIKKGSFIVLLLGSVLFAVLSNSCGSSSNEAAADQDSISGDISVSGAFALYPMATRWAEEYQKLHPEVRINISAGGAGKGMADVLAGMVDLAMFSREVTGEELDKGAWPLAVSRDAVLATVSSRNPMMDYLRSHGMKRSDFEKIFVKGNLNNWERMSGKGGPSHINVFTRSDACGAAEMWALYLGVHQEDLIGTGVFGDPGMASAVKEDKNAVGYNNLNYVYDVSTRKKYDGLEVIPIDLNENGLIDSSENFYSTMDELTAAIKSGLYPSPPARDLYFVSKGKPERAVVRDFLRWVLTDGQKFIHEAGYVELPEEQLSGEITKLN